MLGTYLRMLNSRSWGHHRIYIFEKPSDSNVEDGLTEKGLVGDRETYMDILMIKGEKTKVWIKTIAMGTEAFLVTQLVKNLPAMQENWVLIPGLGRFPGEGAGYPFQYSGLENSMDCIVHGVTKSWTWQWVSQTMGTVVDRSKRLGD